MDVYRDFDFKVDKKRTVNAIAAYWEMPSCDAIDRAYDKLIYELKSLIRPVGIFRMDIKPAEYDFNFLEGCEKIFFCVLTIGEDVCKRVGELFNNGEYFEAILLDLMASTLMFEYTHQLDDKIHEEAGKLGMNITCRICPGDGEMPIEYQSDIIHRIGDTNDYGIYIKTSNVLYPGKSMSFVYGAGKNISLGAASHSCSECANTYCSMRKD